MHSDIQGKDVGIPLKEMPLTEHTASELVRLYLDHNKSNFWGEKASKKKKKKKSHDINTEECTDVMVSEQFSVSMHSSL